MADVQGTFYTASKVRTGTSPSSPGLITGTDPNNPVNPAGVYVSHPPVTIGSPANGLEIGLDQVLTLQIGDGLGVDGYGRLEATGGGSGHIIVDEDDVELPQQPKLKFERLIVTDDDTNEQTVVSRPADTSINLTRPTDPLEGDEWTDPETFKTYKFYDSYWVELPSSGSGGGGGESDPFYIEVTYTEAVSLVGSNSLIKGATYKISGVYKNKTGSDYPAVLYDDGTDSGTTVYLTALTDNTFSREGWGEFYNPKYFSFEDYENTDGTGLYGIWDGDNPDVDEIPEYVEDQVVFWGGYVWINLTGDIGTTIDVLNLDATNWEKLPYSETDYYQKVIDYVEVDFENDVVLRRVDRANNIDVTFSLLFHQYNGFEFHPISVMCWGNSNKEEYRFNDIEVKYSYVEFVNFKGSTNYSNSVSFLSYIQDNYFGKGVRMGENSLTKYSYITSNTLKSVYISENSLNSYSAIESNVSYGTTFTTIRSNVLTNSGIYTNDLGGDCEISYNTMRSSAINGNNLSETSLIVENNLFENCSISNNALTSGSVIRSNGLNFGSFIVNNILSLSTVYRNILNTSQFDFGSSGTLTSKNIEYINVNFSDVIFNISSATTIYGNFHKQIFRRQDGGIRLGYYNNSNVFTVVNVNA